jgi:hypothetical protein
VRLYLERRDNNKINPTPVGFTLIENLDLQTNFYKKGEYICQTGNNQQCNTTITFPTLPAGEYRVHCDMPQEPQKCSGNPTCSWHGGPFSCEGWTTCGQNDMVSFTVTAPPPEPTTTDPDYNNNNAVDIYDFNTLLSGYNTTNCGFNLTGTCLIDITDYNFMVNSFGNRY